MSRFRGLLSEKYDLVIDAVAGYEDQEFALAREIARKHLGPRVFDIGVGTGYTSLAILEANPGSEVVAVDREPAMVEQARRRLAPSIAEGKVTVLEADALDYAKGVPDGFFDVVASCFTLHNCRASYRADLEREVFRVLRQGGMFINNDKFASDDWCEYRRELVEQLTRYDVLEEEGGPELRRLWLAHEVDDQHPERIMITSVALRQLKEVGFREPALVSRLGQYALMIAEKTEEGVVIAAQGNEN